MNDLESHQELQLAEGQGVSEPQAPDLAWESELVQMLSALESFRVNLHDDCLAGRRLPALETMLAVAKGVSAFLRPRFEDAPPLQAVQAFHDVFLAAARPLHDRLDDTVQKMLLRFLRFRRETGDPNAQFLAAGHRLESYLNAAFVLCARRFVSPTAAQSWTETYTVFLDELDGLFQTIES
jgi:hypothetical protein